MSSLIKFFQSLKLGVYLGLIALVAIAALVASNLYLMNSLADANKAEAIASTRADGLDQTIQAYKDGAAGYEKAQGQLRSALKTVSTSLSSANIQSQAAENGQDPADLLNERYASLNGMFTRATTDPDASGSASASADQP